MGILSTVREQKIRSVSVVVLLLIILLASFLYTNKIAPVSWNVYGATSTDNGVALQGVDVVAFHTEGKRVQGDAKYSFKTKDAIWYFASEANKKMFTSSPDKYKPQYGGYCAFAVSKGATAVSSPESWTIQDGKLYVFNAPDVKKTWISEIGKGSITNADANWGARSLH